MTRQISILRVATLLLLHLLLLPANTRAWTKRQDAHGKTIIAYYASWQWYDRNHLAKPSNLDHSKVTRYNFAFFQINANGDIWGTDEWADPITLYGEFDWNALPDVGTKYCSWDHPVEAPNCAGHKDGTGLIQLAHEAGVEVYPSIGGWTLSDPFPALASSEEGRRRFADNCVRLIEEYDFDGIDIDWEYPGYAAHSGTPADTVNYSLFLGAIRDALDELGNRSGRFYGLTAALPCGPDLIDNIQIDVVSNILTELNLMTYDFHGSWNAETGVNAPLFDMDGSPEFSVHGCVENWKNGGGRPDQINIGLPFYGRSFAGSGLTGFGQSHNGYADTVTWSDDEGSPQYFNIVDKLSQFTSLRHAQTKTQIAYNNQGLVSYDDELAICDKTEYAMDHNLNGYIIWEISGDLLPDLSTPLLDATNDRLNNPRVRCESEPEIAAVASEAGPAAAVASGEDSAWYPKQSWGFCVNDGKQLDNYVAPDHIFGSAQACCGSIFKHNTKCLESSLDPSSAGVYVNDKENPWYQHPSAGHCVNDGKEGQYFIMTSELYSSAKKCCGAHFSFDSKCESKSTSPQNGGKWYPSGGGCTDEFPIPGWISKTFSSNEKCCKNSFPYFIESCLADSPDDTPEEVPVVTPNPTPHPTKQPTHSPKKPTEGDLSTTEATIAVQSKPAPKPEPNPPPTISLDNGLPGYKPGWDLFYPYYDAEDVSIECRNDGRAPDWISNDMMKSNKYECCTTYFFDGWVEECLSNNPFYPDFEEKSCLSDGNHPQYMAGDYLTDELWECCHNSYSGDEKALEQCTGIPALGCSGEGCTIDAYLDSYYDTGSSATAATIATSTRATSTVPLPPSSTPGGGTESTSNYCGKSWADANGKCARSCPRGTDEECPDGEKCYADCVGCAAVSGGSGPCGWGNVGSGVCEQADLCCSQYGWCGVGPNYCSQQIPTLTDTAATISSISSDAETYMLQRDSDWLESHNSRRKLWHENYGKQFVPLKWSGVLKEQALIWAQFLAESDQFYHDPDKGSYGENIAMNSGGGGQRTTEDILSRWVEDEAYDSYPANGHLTQVLWRATEWVGCAESKKGDRHVQVCRYFQPGNCNMGMYGGWEEPTMMDESHCGDNGDFAEAEVSTVATLSSIGTETSSVTQSDELSSASSRVEVILESKQIALDNNILLFQKPTMDWEPSSVYKSEDLIAALRVMFNDGVANKRFYAGDDSPNGHLYGLVNVAAFLAQAMKETIKYNVCDENSWDMVAGGYPASNACGQLAQSYQDYGCADHEKHLECPVRKDMSITATSNAKWWGAPPPLFCGPKSEHPSPGYWDPFASCKNNVCDIYESQQGGAWVDGTAANSGGRVDVEGCCWWGRGVIQSTGVCNYGKLNYYLGARAAEEGRDSRYPDINFCERPDAVCASEEHAELKWLAGMFYWVESLQSYDVGGWNYIDELHKFVDNGMADGNSFINSVSGIVNRGCHDPPCATGSVDGGHERTANFIKVLKELDLT